MKYNVNKINSKYDFLINAPSYIGEPKSNTFMFISKKVEYMYRRSLSYVRCNIRTISGSEEVKREWEQQVI